MFFRKGSKVVETARLMAAIGLDSAQPPKAPAKARRLGIRAKLMLAISAVAAITLLAGAISWTTYASIERLLNGITHDTYPGVTQALKLAESASRLGALASALEGAQSQLQRQSGHGALRQQVGQITPRLPDLGLMEADRSAVDTVAGLIDQLLRSVDRLNGQVARRLNLEIDRHKALDQLSATVASYRTTLATLSASQGNDLSGPLPVLALSGTTLVTMAAEATIATDPSHLADLRRRYATDIDLLAAALERLPADGWEASRLKEIVGRMAALGVGKRSLFELRAEEMGARNDTAVTAHAVRDLIGRISAAVSHLAVQAESRAEAMNQEAAIQLSHGRLQILVIALVALVGPGLFLWLYLNRSVFGRLSALATDARRLASGHLDAPIQRSGDDEITEMA
ncbi:MAG TPA: hypothetical protein VEB64_12025, partial [Azospirillaceae bacterium]|nr:hypothetical protein [Azospirillaceae bacterium]